MAPELRKRKPAGAQNSNGTVPKAVEKKQTTTKRKAPEDALPVSLKKQKSTKKAEVAKKAPAPSTKATKSAKATEPAGNPVKASKPAKATEAADKPAKARKSAKETKTVAKKQEDAPEDEQSDSEDQEENGGLMMLVDEMDSGDDEAADKAAEFKPGQAVGKVPAISTEAAGVARAPTGRRGVIYVGRIPHGFYEYEMRQYLSQFGPISRLRLSRNKKTGASKHFAFVEFEEETTAEIVAKTMDNYLLFGHILKVKVVPKDQIHENLFQGANRRFKKVPWNKMAGKKLAKPLTESAWSAKLDKERANRAKKADKLKELGYEFEGPVLKEVPTPQRIDQGEADAAAIEAAPTVDEDKDAGEPEAKAVEVKEPEPEPEVEATSAPKAKTATRVKAPRSGKAQRSKA